MVKLGTFVALGVRGVKSLRIGVLTWVSFMLKWVKQIGICRNRYSGKYTENHAFVGMIRIVSYM